MVHWIFMEWGWHCGIRSPWSMLTHLCLEESYSIYETPIQDFQDSRNHFFPLQNSLPLLSFTLKPWLLFCESYPWNLFHLHKNYITERTQNGYLYTFYSGFYPREVSHNYIPLQLIGPELVPAALSLWFQWRWVKINSLWMQPNESVLSILVHSLCRLMTHLALCLGSVFLLWKLLCYEHLIVEYPVWITSPVPCDYCILFCDFLQCTAMPLLTGRQTSLVGT